MKKVLVPVLSLILCAGILFGVDKLTAPIIAEKEAASASGALKEMLDGAKEFESVDLASLKDVSPFVVALDRETAGLGYVVSLSTTEGYTHLPIEFLMSVGSDGKIAKTKLTSYPDSKDFGADYPGTYVGQDSALADVSLVSGVTFSSAAFKNAVSGAFDTLIANDLIKAGVKGDEQILKEMLPEVHAGMADRSEAADGTVKRNVKIAALSTLPEGVQEGYKAVNGSGCAFILKAGEKTVMAVTNTDGAVKAVDTEGQDVTASLDAALLDSLKAASAAALKNYDGMADKLAKRVSDSAAAEALPLEGVFNSVVKAVKITDNGKTYYGFASLNYGFLEETMMEIFTVIDENGAIYKMGATELILEKEYFTAYQLQEDSYRAGFEGKTADTYEHSTAVITGATISTNAVDAGVRDAFEAFKVLTGAQEGAQK